MLLLETEEMKGQMLQINAEITIWSYQQNVLDLLINIKKIKDSCQHENPAKRFECSLAYIFLGGKDVLFPTNADAPTFGV